MKKTILFTVLILSLVSCHRTKALKNEDYKKNLKTDFLEYHNLLLNQEFEKSLDFIIPEFFEFIPKSKLVLLMERTYNSPEIEFEIGEPKEIYFGDILEIRGKYYSEINYGYDMQVKFVNVEKSENKQENESIQNFYKLRLKETFGSDSVIFDKETDFYHLDTSKKCYAVSNDGKSEWKFIIIEKGQEYIWDDILPKELLIKL